MVIPFLVLVPLAAGVLAFAVRDDRLRRLLLPLTGLAHFALAVSTWSAAPAPVWGGLLELDSLGTLFLGITSGLFLPVSFYCVGYLAREQHGDREDFEQGQLFSNAPEAVFVACMLFFLAAMTLVTVCQHLGLLWVGIEATTLASAPLIYFHRHRRSLEATWKYLMICSVGIALALMGYMLLAVSTTGVSPDGLTMTVRELTNYSDALRIPWLKAAFIFFLVGYGTKVGLAPLHTWLPDAHSEAPSAASALLSGALLNCAFLGLLRALQVCTAAGLRDFCGDMLTVLGLLSMGVAAVFIIGQKDYKRMLAYSSVEHMGIMALGVGLGGGAVFGAVLHALNHSLTKGMLFMVAGNILAVYRTKSTADVRGVLRAAPATGVLWLVGFFAITGSPPFGPFMSEFSILKGALDGGAYLSTSLYLLFLAIIFVGMATAALRMAQGTPPENMAVTAQEPLSAVFPAALLAAVVTMLGVYVPGPLQALIHEAARSIGGS